MEWWIGIYVVLAGLAVGSYLNVVIYRVPQNLSTAKGNSFCPFCRHTLNWLDLFPLFSYLFLRGKCRHCGASISMRYPVVEGLNALSWLAVWLLNGTTVLSLVYGGACSCLIALAFIDIDHQIIPNRFPLLIAACGIAAGFASPLPTWPERLIGMLAVSLPMLAIVLLTNGMGEGDVKLFAACGLLLGWKLILMTLLFASVSAALYGLVLMRAKGADRKTAIPFGPFIVLGAGISLLVGNPILDWYFSFLLGM